MQELRERGVKVASVEETNDRFFEPQRITEAHIISLVKKRSLERDNASDEYLLGPGDQLEINVFDIPELNLVAEVRESGFITLPLIGAVEALGKTKEEIALELRTRLGSFVVEPQVSIHIALYGSQRVAVLGAVKAPGMFPLEKGENSLLELVGRAGGLSETAGNYLNFIPAELSGLAASGDAEARARLSLASFDKPRLNSTALSLPIHKIFGTGGGIPLAITVQGGDMIIVPGGGKYSVQGEVVQSGVFPLSREATLLTALASAGGITYSAKVDEIEIIRPNRTSEESLRLIVDLSELINAKEEDVLLMAGDTIRVPSDSDRKLRQDTFESISRFINFGVGGQVNIAN